MLEEVNWTTVIVSFLSSAAVGIPATIVALRTGRAVDGRLAELLETAKKAAKAEGKLEQRDEASSNRRRQD